MHPSASQKTVHVIFPAHHMDLASIFGDGGTDFCHKFMMFSRKSSPSAACYRSNLNGISMYTILCSSVSNQGTQRQPPLSQSLYLLHDSVSNAELCSDFRTHHLLVFYNENINFLLVEFHSGSSLWAPVRLIGDVHIAI